MKTKYPKSERRVSEARDRFARGAERNRIHRVGTPDETLTGGQSTSFKEQGFLDKELYRYKGDMLPYATIRICTPDYMRNLVRCAWDTCRESYLAITILEDNEAGGKRECTYEGCKSISWISGSDGEFLQTSMKTFPISEIIAFQICN